MKVRNRADVLDNAPAKNRFEGVIEVKSVEIGGKTYYSSVYHPEYSYSTIKRYRYQGILPLSIFRRISNHFLAPLGLKKIVNKYIKEVGPIERNFNNDEPIKIKKKIA
jgi:hypothetical protein